MDIKGHFKRLLYLNILILFSLFTLLHAQDDDEFEFDDEEFEFDDEEFEGLDDFDFEDEYVTEETEIDLDEDYDPTDLSEIWHPDVADTLQAVCEDHKRASYDWEEPLFPRQEN